MILLLNGCSSAGKTSIAQSIQYLSETPWLSLGMDHFFDMMPLQYVAFGEKSIEGIHFSYIKDPAGPRIHIDNGPWGERVLCTIPKVIRTMADQKLELIVDEVLFGDDILKEYVKALKGHTVYFFGIECSLPVMLEREILRKDRRPGLCRDQMERVHGPTRYYDLVVDTTHNTPFECARHILNFVRMTPQPLSFKTLESIFFKE